jgi:hypothetical protein
MHWALFWCIWCGNWYGGYTFHCLDVNKIPHWYDRWKQCGMSVFQQLLSKLWIYIYSTRGMYQVYFSFSTVIVTNVDINSFHKTDVSSTVLATLVLIWRLYPSSYKCQHTKSALAWQFTVKLFGGFNKSPLFLVFHSYCPMWIIATS